MPAKRAKGSRRLKAKRVTRKARNSSDHQVVTRSTADGLSFIGAGPTLRTLPYQDLYRFDLIAPAVKRYSMSVGTSPIVDLINFQVSDLPQIATFQALFDQYRIKNVVVYFKTQATQVYWGNSSGDVPSCTTAIDYNDNSTDLAPAVQFQTAVTNPMTTTFVRALQPRTAVPVYNGITTSAYMMGEKDAWLDLNFPSIPHYQLVVNIGSTSIDNQFVYVVDVLYTVEFRTVL